MAEAVVSKKTTTEITRVSLFLSKEEADAVASVLGSVGGDPKDSPRKYTAAVANALSENDIRHDKSQFRDYITGTLTFHTRPRNRDNDFDSVWISPVF